jgi:hypothetical protein
MRAYSRPPVTGGSLIGITSLCITMAMLTGGAGGEVMREIVSSGGATTLILVLGILLTMSLSGISAIASLTLYVTGSILEGGLVLLERRPAR